MGRPGDHFLLTGSTGYLGSLLAAGLLAEPAVRLTLPVRPHHQPDQVLARIEGELSAEVVGTDWRKRVNIVPLPPLRDLPALAPALRRQGVRTIIHAAGCVDYFNNEALDEGNIALTRAFVELGHELPLDRFAFISTAFSSGCRADIIPESLHETANEDPTDYTRSKRAAEAIVARSGLPYLIARPSIVIGDSRTGQYRGKRYGIYQLWGACEKLLCVEYIPELYAIAPPTKLPLLHQDAFQSGFIEALRALPDNSIIHLVSRNEVLPTVRELWQTMITDMYRPRVMHCYHRLADVPMERLNRRQQMWVELTGVNLEISSRDWLFARDTLDRLCVAGLQFADVTPESIAVCQNRFVAESMRMQEYMRRYAKERSASPQLIEHA